MVGERITDARRSRGLSIDDVAATTRLRPMTIEAIEDDDFPCVEETATPSDISG